MFLAWNIFIPYNSCCWKKYLGFMFNSKAFFFFYILIEMVKFLSLGHCIKALNMASVDFTVTYLTLAVLVWIVYCVNKLSIFFYPRCTSTFYIPFHFTNNTLLLLPLPADVDAFRIENRHQFLWFHRCLLTTDLIFLWLPVLSRT